jgi:hypothetical protein
MLNHHKVALPDIMRWCVIRRYADIIGVICVSIVEIEINVCVCVDCPVGLAAVDNTDFVFGVPQLDFSVDLRFAIGQSNGHLLAVGSDFVEDICSISVVGIEENDYTPAGDRPANLIGIVYRKLLSICPAG